MHALGFLFSPSGRLRPRPFVIAAAGVYAVGVASHALTTADVIARVGLWAFVAVQALLVWIWFALHAKRLRDAGRGVGLAVGVGLLYVLSIVLLVILAAAFFNTAAADTADPNTASALGLILLVAVIAALGGAANYDVAWLLVAALTLIALVPLIVTALFTLWAATRPSSAEPKA
ncbi:MAG: hypothetical protein C5B56_05540 [Proteobacteria bacterium]|nr:MAG: hypothetical protein C5B56_05540 [Pseudomonadota bacterium]